MGIMSTFTFSTFTVYFDANTFTLTFTGNIVNVGLLFVTDLSTSSTTV